MAQVQYIGTGRRKSSTARVRLVPGEGKVVINNRDVADYLPYETLHLIINQPLVATETKGSYDVHVNVNGGGFTGQVEQSVTVSHVHYYKLIQTSARL